MSADPARTLALLWRTEPRGRPADPGAAWTSTRSCAPPRRSPTPAARTGWRA